MCHSGAVLFTVWIIYISRLNMFLKITQYMMSTGSCRVNKGHFHNVCLTFLMSEHPSLINIRASHMSTMESVFFFYI